MKLKEIGKSGIFASEISIGTFGMGGGTAWSDTGNDTAASVRLLEEAYDRGVTFFDSAPVYGGGQAEEILAQAIRGRRDKVVIGTKCSLQWREEYGLFEYTATAAASTATSVRRACGRIWRTASAASASAGWTNCSPHAGFLP